MAVSTMGRPRAPALGAPAGLPGASEDRMKGIAGSSPTPFSASTAISRRPMIRVLGLSGLAVAQVLPAQVLDRLHAEARGLRLEVHGGQLAARAQLAEGRVEEGGCDVQVLGARQGHQER